MTTMDPDRELLSSEMDSKLSNLFLLFAIILVVQVIVGIVIYLSFGSWGDRGTFGDMFGAVNTLFSGLAFAGVIYAILLQRDELRLQRLELQLTREELARSTSAQEVSSRALSQQLAIMEESAELDREQKKMILQFKEAPAKSADEKRERFIQKATNIGGWGSNLHLEPQLYDLRGSFSAPQVLSTGDEITLRVYYPKPTDIDQVAFTLYYTDSLGTHRWIKFIHHRKRKKLAAVDEGTGRMP